MFVFGYGCGKVSSVVPKARHGIIQFSFQKNRNKTEIFDLPVLMQPS